MIKKISKFFTLKNSILLVLFLCLFFLLRWNSFNTPFERDEGEYAYSAWLMSKGGVPYKDTFLQKPPLIIYTYWIGQLFSVGGLWTPRFLAAVFTLLTTYLLAKIAASEFGDKAFWITAFIFTPIVVSPINSGLAANTEIFMILPLTGLLYLYVFYKDNPDIKIWFISGVLSVLSILYKPIALYVIAFIYFDWFYRLIKTKTNPLALSKFILVVAVGGSVTTFVILLPFLIKGAGKNIWEEVVIFNQFYASQWGYDLGPFLANLKLLWRSFWLVFILTFAYFVIPAKNKFLYAGLMLFSILATYQTTIRHYFILFMPYLAILSAAVIIKLSDVKIINQKFRSKVPHFLTLFTVLTIIWPLRAQLGLSPAQLNLWIYGTENPFYEALLVAEKLKSITNPSDKVFIAGSEPQILYYALRQNVSRFDITYPLIIKTPVREQYQKEAINELMNNEPAAIVFSTRQHSGLWNEESPRYFIDYLTKLINTKYILKGGYVWTRNGGYWSDSLTKTEFQNSSLLLYQKI